MNISPLWKHWLVRLVNKVASFRDTFIVLRQNKSTAKKLNWNESIQMTVHLPISRLSPGIHSFGFFTRCQSVWFTHRAWLDKANNSAFSSNQTSLNSKRPCCPVVQVIDCLAGVTKFKWISGLNHKFSGKWFAVVLLFIYLSILQNSLYLQISF